MEPEELKAKKARLAALNDQLRDIRKEGAALAREIAEAESPFKTGDKITWKHGTGRRTGVIQGVATVGQYMTRVIRADGSDGALIRVYEYQDPQLWKESA